LNLEGNPPALTCGNRKKLVGLEHRIVKGSQLEPGKRAVGETYAGRCHASLQPQVTARTSELRPRTQPGVLSIENKSKENFFEKAASGKRSAGSRLPCSSASAMSHQAGRRANWIPGRLLAAEEDGKNSSTRCFQNARPPQRGSGHCLRDHPIRQKDGYPAWPSAWRRFSLGIPL